MAIQWWTVGSDHTHWPLDLEWTKTRWCPRECICWSYPSSENSIPDFPTGGSGSPSPQRHRDRTEYNARFRLAHTCNTAWGHQDLRATRSCPRDRECEREPDGHPADCSPTTSLIHSHSSVPPEWCHNIPGHSSLLHQVSGIGELYWMCLSSQLHRICCLLPKRTALPFLLLYRHCQFKFTSVSYVSPFSIASTTSFSNWMILKSFEE